MSDREIALAAALLALLAFVGLVWHSLAPDSAHGGTAHASPRRA